MDVDFNSLKTQCYICREYRKFANIDIRLVDMHPDCSRATFYKLLHCNNVDSCIESAKKITAEHINDCATSYILERGIKLDGKH